MTKRKSTPAEPNAGESLTASSQPSGGNGKPRPETESGPASAFSPNAEGGIPVEVGQHTFEPPSFLGRILSLPTGTETGIDEAPAKKKLGRPPKSGGAKGEIKLSVRELADILTVVGLFFLQRWDRLPEPAKPTQEEVNEFMTPLASIVLRHTPPIAATADTLDLAKMLLAGFAWYQRVAPFLEKAQAAEQAETEPISEVVSHAEKPRPEDNGRKSGLVELAPSRTGLYAGSG